MAVGKQGSGPLWADGQFTLRVRGPGSTPGRVVRIRKPFALVGRHPDADIRIDDPSVEDRHAVLLLDRRGLFGVDLLSESGTRFAGAVSGSSWLGLGDIFEVAGRRVELVQIRVDGQPIDPPLSNDDPFSGVDDGSLIPLTLEPLDAPGPPWMVGSSLAFLGRGDACAIKVEDESASDTHCAVLRGPTSAYVIDLISHQTLINDSPVDGASALVDGDVLTIGEARFTVNLGSAGTDLVIHRPRSAAIEVDPRSETLKAWLVEAVAEGLGSPHEQVLTLLRQFQSDASSLFEAQLERMEMLNEEIASLRAEVRRLQPTSHFPEPAQPFRADLLPESPTLPPTQTPTWLLERLNGLERESRSTWRDLLGKISSTVGARTNPPRAGTSLVPTPSNSPNDA